MARAQPGSWASPVNGDEVRGTSFFRRESLWGYDASAADDLLAGPSTISTTDQTGGRFA